MQKRDSLIFTRGLWMLFFYSHEKKKNERGIFYTRVGCKFPLKHRSNWYFPSLSRFFFYRDSTLKKGFCCRLPGRCTTKFPVFFFTIFWETRCSWAIQVEIGKYYGKRGALRGCVDLAPKKSKVFYSGPPFSPYFTCRRSFPSFNLHFFTQKIALFSHAKSKKHSLFLSLFF